MPDAQMTRVEFYSVPEPDVPGLEGDPTHHATVYVTLTNPEPSSRETDLMLAAIARRALELSEARVIGPAGRVRNVFSPNEMDEWWA